MWNSFKNDLKIVSTQAFNVSECQFWDLDFWMNDHKKKLIRDCATYLFSFSNQNMFSLSVFQSHCVVVVKLDNFFTEAPNYNCRAVLWQKSTVVYAQKCANLCTPVILVCSAAVDAHVLLRSAHLSVLSCSRAQELSMQRCYICLIRSAEMGHNNENSSQSLCSNNSVNSWSLISSGATNIPKIRKLEK
mgnify:CR=1 FL=1